MKIVAISDLHGTFPDVEPSDLLIIAGDIVPLNIQFKKYDSLIWFIRYFKKWSKALPVDKVLFIAGNHDALPYDDPDVMFDLFPKENKVTYLENELYEYNGLKIFGTPYCHKFGNWPFMVNDNELRNLYYKIPENLDILFAHDMPYNCSDQCLGFDKESDRELHRGSMPLQEVLLEKNPKYFIGGHLHTCSHEWKQYYNTQVICSSIKDEKYIETYNPIYFEI